MNAGDSSPTRVVGMFLNPPAGLYGTAQSDGGTTTILWVLPLERASR